MRVDLLALEVGSYRCHVLHGPESVWTETNCAADLWIELLHALGCDPVAGLAFTLGTGFDGDQWRMFTFPPEILHAVYGIDVDELNVWRPLRTHVAEQLSLGNLVSFDVDAWWLPDTAGLTYRSAHQKTTVLVTKIDTETGRLGYLHNAGYYELDGDDFDALLPADPCADSMPPFTLQVRLDALRTGPPDPAVVRHFAQDQIARRPSTNPVRRMAMRVVDDLEWLRSRGLDAFHRWAFGTLRQCGSNAELAAAFSRLLDTHGVEGAASASELLTSVAVGMKAAELALARAVRGREVDVHALFSPLSTGWTKAIEDLASGLGSAGAEGSASGDHRAGQLLTARASHHRLTEVPSR